MKETQLSFTKENTQHLLSTYDMPGTILSILYVNMDVKQYF